MKNTVKVYANYNGSRDKYVASISNSRIDDVITCKNGEDLVKEVLSKYGVEITYNFSQRTFEIPAENRFE